MYSTAFLINSTTLPTINISYISGIYKYSDCPSFFPVYIQLSLNITSAIGQRQFSFVLKRADGTILRTVSLIKQSGVTNYDGNVLLMTYVNGPTDPFVIQGFKISAFTDTGTGTITNCKMFIDTRLINV